MSQSNEKLMRIIEAALLAANEPLNVKRVQRLFDGDRPDAATVKEAFVALQQECESRAYELKEVASGWRFQVREDYSEWVSRLWEEKPQRYTRALLETLALIAYKQPITRGEIEDVRGVSVSSNIIRTLQEREWIRVVGHRDVPGRPALYATSKEFLDYFNLQSLQELPSLAELKDIDEIGKNAEEALSKALAKAGVTLEEAKQLHEAKETGSDDQAEGSEAEGSEVNAETDAAEENAENTDAQKDSAAELATDDILSEEEQALTIHAQEEN